ncbi:MAG TPA: SPOR domain-containing protein, partial [Candidatus Binatus sp.]|nr:SPOR domain-containing protein [Candidatus Binatus sp.]
VPSQPAVPSVVTPQPTPPSAPTAARPTGQAQATQQQPEQLRIVADPATNSLIIYGTAQEFQNIKNILKELDAIPRQVLLDVMVAEVTLTDDESFGIAYEIFRGQNTIFGQTFPSTGAVSGGSIPAAPTDSTGAAIAGALTSFGPGISGIIGRSNAIRAFINALATQNRIKALASPSVLATDNHPARIQVGSEIPILTGQTSTFTGTSTPLTSNAIQYRNTGVILTLIPQVNSQGLVNLQVKQEVSDVGSPNFGSTGSPSFTTRDAETNAVVQDGDTLAIGGIIAERKTRDRSGIPYLMDIPVLGRFFGTTSDHSTRTELVILITPHVIRNIDESRSVTQELKNKLSDVKNELERLARERAQRQPRPGSQQLPPMPDPNQFYNDQVPQPAPKKAAPGQGASLLAPMDNSFALLSNQFTPRSSTVPSIEGLGLRNPLAMSIDGVQPQNQQLAAANIQAVQPSSEQPPAAYALSIRPARADPPAAPVLAGSSLHRHASTPPTRIWCVQVAALAQNKDAQALAERLRKRGYAAFVLTTRGENKTWHRVRVGHLDNQKAATELRKSLIAEKEYQTAYIAMN